MTFYTPDWGQNAKLAYAYVTYTFMMMAYTVVNVPMHRCWESYPRCQGQEHTVFVQDVLCLRREFHYLHDPATACRYFQQNPSADGRISAEPMAWTAAVAVIGAICAILFFFCFRWTKERVKVADQNKDKASIGTDLKLLFTNRPWWILLASGVSALLFNSIRDGVALFYFSDYVTLSYRTAALQWTLGTIYLLVGQAANMIGVALAAPVANKIGKKNVPLCHDHGSRP